MMWAGLYTLGAAGMFAYLRRTIDHPGRDASRKVDAAIAVVWPVAFIGVGLAWLAFKVCVPAPRSRVYRHHSKE